MNDVFLRDIGRRIQIRRKQQRFTQEQLADMMNVSIQMVSNLERGNKAIRIDNLINLSKILGVSTDFILTGEETRGDLTGLAVQIAHLSEKNKKMIRMLVEYCLQENP